MNVTITLAEYQRFADRQRRDDERIAALSAQVRAADAERSARSDEQRREEGQLIAFLRRENAALREQLGSTTPDVVERFKHAVGAA